MKRIRKKKRSDRRPGARTVRWLIAPVLLTAGAALACGLVEFVRKGTYFELREIEVTGNDRCEREEIIGCLNLRMGDNTLLLGKSEVRRRVEAHPWVRRARVGKRLPNTLWIEIEERRPVALLSNAKEQKLFGLDAEGYVLPPIPVDEIAKNHYPIVTGIPAVLVFAGNPIEFPQPEPVPATVSALQQTRHLRDDVSEIHWNPERGYVLYPRSGAEQLILGKGSIRERMATLDQAWAFFTEEGIDTRYVDVRFEAQGAVFQAQSLSEREWLAYVTREKTSPRRLAAVTEDEQ